MSNPDFVSLRSFLSEHGGNFRDWQTPDGVMQAALQEKIAQQEDPWDFDHKIMLALRRLVSQGAYDTVAGYLAQVQDLHPYLLHYFNGPACPHPLIGQLIQQEPSFWAWMEPIVMQDRLDRIFIEHQKGFISEHASDAEILIYLQAEMENPDPSQWRYQAGVWKYAADSIFRRYPNPYRQTETEAILRSLQAQSDSRIAEKRDLLAVEIRGEIVRRGMAVSRRAAESALHRLNRSDPTFTRGQTVFFFSGMPLDGCTTPFAMPFVDPGENTGIGVVVMAKWLSGDSVRFGESEGWRYLIQPLKDARTLDPVGKRLWVPDNYLDLLAIPCCNDEDETACSINGQGCWLAYKLDLAINGETSEARTGKIRLNIADSKPVKLNVKEEKPTLKPQVKLNVEPAKLPASSAQLRIGTPKLQAAPTVQLRIGASPENANQPPSLPPAES